MNRIFTLNILLVLLCSIILAKLSADIVSYRLSRAFPKTSPKASAPKPPVAVEDLASFSPILERGLFGKATQGKLTPIVQEDEGKSRAATSQKDLLLLGTAVGSFNETFALIQKLSTKEERVFRLGDEVYGIGELVAVQKEMAEILAGNARIKIYTPLSAAPRRKNHLPPAGQPGALASQVGAGELCHRPEGAECLSGQYGAGNDRCKAPAQRQRWQS